MILTIPFALALVNATQTSNNPGNVRNLSANAVIETFRVRVRVRVKLTEEDLFLSKYSNNYRVNMEIDLSRPSIRACLIWAFD
jgi:hypothetical protein